MTAHCFVQSAEQTEHIRVNMLNPYSLCAQASHFLAFDTNTRTSDSRCIIKIKKRHFTCTLCFRLACGIISFIVNYFVYFAYLPK